MSRACLISKRISIRCTRPRVTSGRIRPEPRAQPALVPWPHLPGLLHPHNFLFTLSVSQSNLALTLAALAEWELSFLCAPHAVGNSHASTSHTV